ncbi:endonuclease III domain-containing protein [Aceticella autotrophica]|uniref:Endonuclease III domain-containing protein n=1 Tax=Aceticella autotrophica TaxID=2755338 RepID=A0A975GBG8_9THEO|nr:endonuclease [Aceticella autotrophica]QSZ28151.1 endonuclease III domain-containing protein [Aceticella autotrophica]
MRNTLLDIYNKLFSFFGPQNWWPADSAFEVIIGAILTQSVSWKNVEKAIINLKDEGILSIEGIINVQNQKLANLIRSTLYHNQKADKLKRFCLYVKEKYDSDIFKIFDKNIYELRKELLLIKGIGKETADSIILYAANKPIFVVDAYTKRIFTRLGYLKGNEDYQIVQDFFMNNLPCNTYLFNEYHALIVALGKNYCQGKNPCCDICPLKTLCSYNRSI